MNFIHRHQPHWITEFDRLLTRSRHDEPFRQAPHEVLRESGEAWSLQLDLPGFRKEDLSVTVTDRTLQLSATAPADNPFGTQFERQWKLGRDIDAEAVKARLENGVLELTLPKRPKQEPESKTIEIR